ncbi:MAG: HAD family phosphatase [Treponema sp.]|nr:HAD family phosphatase [Treponema sp.]
MAEISLILSDLDGTLFHDDKTISAYTKQVIAKAQRKDILFGISTSRAMVNAVKFLDGISPDIFITNGGGMVLHRGKKIYSCEFSVSEVRTLIEATFAVLGNDAVLSVDNEVSLYSNSKDELGDKFWTFNEFSDFSETGMKICIQTLDREKVEKIASAIGIENVDYLPVSDIPWYKLSIRERQRKKL